MKFKFSRTNYFLKGFLKNNIAKNPFVQKVLFFIYYIFFSYSIFWGNFQPLSIFIAFIIGGGFILMLDTFEKKYTVMGFYIFIYIYFIYYISTLLILKEINAINLLIYCAYFFVYLNLNKFLTKKFPTTNNIEIHYLNEFSLLKNLKKYTGIFFLITIPILKYATVDLWFNIIFSQVVIILYFYAIITVLLGSLVDLLIFYSLNPISKGTYLVCKLCGFTAITYMTAVGSTATFAFIAPVHLPLEAFIQKKAFGMYLPTMGHKSVYYQYVAMYPDHLKNLSVTEKGELDIDRNMANLRILQNKTIEESAACATKGAFLGTKAAIFSSSEVNSEKKS